MVISIYVFSLTRILRLLQPLSFFCFLISSFLSLQYYNESSWRLRHGRMLSKWSWSDGEKMVMVLCSQKAFDYHSEKSYSFTRLLIPIYSAWYLYRLLQFGEDKIFQVCHEKGELEKLCTQTKLIHLQNSCRIWLSSLHFGHLETRKIVFHAKCMH